MRVFKSQCSLFKDLYRAFLQGEVDEETRTWMEQHIQECSYCREWSRSVDENREDIEQYVIVEHNSFDEAKESVIKAKLITVIGMVLIILAAMWTSSWPSI